MSTTNMQVGDVIGWFKSGLNLTFKNPGAFIVMGLVFGIISIVLAFIPVLGAIAMMVLAPVFYGGFIYAAREEDQGRKAEIAHLFVGFQQPGKIGPMMMLCLPSVAAGVVIAILAFVLIGGSIMALAMGGNGGGGMGVLGLLLFALLAFAVGLAAAAMVYFAVPRVMLDNIEPIAAMKESLGVVLANVASILVGFIVIGLIFMVIAIIPLLGALAIFLIGMPASLCAMYFGYRQAFGGSVAQVEPPMPPAPPPVAP